MDARSSATTENPLVTKLETIVRLTEEDRQAITDACADVREVAPHRDIISEGDRPNFVHLMLEGWAARYKVVPDGARQITAYLIPGDFCDVHITVLRKMDHGIVALTPTKVAFISRERMDMLTRDSPELTRALWWATLVDEAVLRAWIVNIGRRDAYERIAHLMCEMHVRMEKIGMVSGHRFELPLTQEQIADTLGLTPVHVNRMLQRLRVEGLIELKGKQLAILDAPALGKAGGFSADYLHTDEQARG